MTDQTRNFIRDTIRNVADGVTNVPEAMERIEALWPHEDEAREAYRAAMKQTPYRTTPEKDVT